MIRYSGIPIISTEENPVRRYVTVKYPSIPLSFNDIYVYTTIGDRYDKLALAYYKDPSLWWIIPIANPSMPFDSLTPPPGSQIRIPTNVTSILANYRELNK